MSAEVPPATRPPVDLRLIEQEIAIKDVERAVAFIHVAGASASGKSTIARYVGSQLPETLVLPIDNYLAEGLWDSSRIFNHDSPNPSKPYIGGISPEIWDLPLLYTHLSQLAIGKTVQIPRFDETIKDRVGYESSTPNKHIVLEGGHAFSEPFVDFADHKIYVRAPLHDRLMRKIVRTHIQYGREDVDEVLGRYLTRDEYACRAYDNEFCQIADQVIENPANPRKDYARMRDTMTCTDWPVQAALTPTDSTGYLHPGEQLTLTAHEATHGIRYTIDGRMLVDLPISTETRNLLIMHYERV